MKKNLIHRNSFLILFIVLLGCLSPLYAGVSSPELDRLQKEVAPNMLPPAIGEKVLPQLELKGGTFDQFSKILEPHGVTVVASQSLQEAKINITLRNLDINRILSFVTQQVGAKWLYHKEKIIVYRSPDDLPADLQEDAINKTKLEKQIKAEVRRLKKIQSKAEKIALRQEILSEFSVNDLTLVEIIKALSDTLNADEDRKVKHIVPILNPKLYQEKRSYKFSNQSVAEILDTLCKDFQVAWDMSGPGVIAVSSK